jgi:hypothetical protein
MCAIAEMHSQGLKQHKQAVQDLERAAEITVPGDKEVCAVPVHRC